jgi:GTP cyclohydrolase I
MDDTERAARIAEHVRGILELVGADEASDPELAGTPDRVAGLALELTSGARGEPEVALLPGEASAAGLVIARDLPFHSLCAHHLLPFFGVAHVGYVPNGRILGVGSIGRALDHFARRLQLQERIGEQLADFLVRAAAAKGAIVVLEARQLCMEMRGGRKSGRIQSTAARGSLAEGPLRREFFDRVLAPPAEDGDG